MERPPSQPERIEVSPELEADLTAEERAEYARLKTELRDVLTAAGVWSKEFNEIIDSKLKYFGMIGKSIEGLGQLKGKRKTASRKQDAEHCLSTAKKYFEEIGLWTPAVESWIEKGAADSLTRVGALMDYMSQAAIAASTNKMMKKNSGTRRS